MFFVIPYTHCYRNVINLNVGQCNDRKCL